MAPFRVIMLPGSVLPAELAYGPLVAALGSDAEVVLKDLEVYATEQPPSDYTLDTEVTGVLREADAHAWEQFHLVGYSGGGAAALAVAARHPRRLSSLAVLEPAWAGNWELSAGEKAVWRAYDRVQSDAPDQFMHAFMQLNVKPGVELPPPPPGDPPPWMAKRPGGIRAFMETFRTYDLDRAALARFDRPVYFALGALSNPDQFGEIAARLGGVFPDFQLEVFQERHHFDSPHRIEPERLAESLRATWRRAEDVGSQPDRRLTARGSSHNVPLRPTKEVRVKFLQTIAWKTSRPDEMKALADRFQTENPDPGPGFVGLKMLKDRDQENSYLMIAEFENYDLAMQNSARPEIDAFNKEMMALADGPPVFGNYDVIDEM